MSALHAIIEEQVFNLFSRKNRPGPEPILQSVWQLGMKQGQIAEELGLKAAAISHYINGTHNLPLKHEVKAYILGLRVYVILGEIRARVSAKDEELLKPHLEEMKRRTSVVKGASDKRAQDFLASVLIDFIDQWRSKVREPLWSLKDTYLRNLEGNNYALAEKADEITELAEQSQDEKLHMAIVNHIQAELDDQEPNCE